VGVHFTSVPQFLAQLSFFGLRSSRFVDMASEVLRLTIQGKLGSIESTVILHEFAVFLSLAPRNNIALTLLIVNGAKNSLRFREFFETFRSFGKIDAVSNITNQGVGKDHTRLKVIVCSLYHDVFSYDIFQF